MSKNLRPLMYLVISASALTAGCDEGKSTMPKPIPTPVDAGQTPDDAGADRDSGTSTNTDAGNVADSGSIVDPPENDAGNVADSGSTVDPPENDADSGSTVDPPSLDACLDGSPPHDTVTERLVLTGEKSRVGLVRFADPDAFGTSGTTPWLVERFAVTHDDDAPQCVEKDGDLTYTVSHHNFDDRLEISVGGQTWKLTQERQGYDFPTRWTITKTRAAQGAWGPIELSLASCVSPETGENCTGRYQ